MRKKIKIWIFFILKRYTEHIFAYCSFEKMKGAAKFFRMIYSYGIY